MSDLFHKGQAVIISTTFGTERGTYIQPLGFRPDMHEVWVNNNSWMARVVHTNNIMEVVTEAK